MRCKVAKHCVTEILISRNCLNRRPPVICDFVMRKMHEKYKENCIEIIIDNFMMILVFKQSSDSYQILLSFLHLSSHKKICRLKAEILHIFFVDFDVIFP